MFARFSMCCPFCPELDVSYMPETDAYLCRRCTFIFDPIRGRVIGVAGSQFTTALSYAEAREYVHG